MPINLKELFIYDTNQIRIEKINYNFDQMLGVGGQLGPKGLKGDFGPIGPEGEKGQKGEIGPTGVAGENGADGFTYWLSVPGTTLDANILKPIFNTNNQNSVYLGDSTQSASSLGNTSTDSVLVIDRPQIYNNHLELKGLYNSLTIKGEFFNSGGTVLDVFSIKKGFGISGSNPVKLDIAFDDVSINTTGNGLLGILSISSSNTVELSAVSGFNVSQGTISTFNDRVFVTGDLIVTGNGFTKVSSGTTSQRNDIATNELEGGVIRYNTSTNKLEAYFEGTSSGSIWLPLRELTDADKDTRVDISLTNDNDTIDLVTKDDVAMRLGGTTQDIGNGDFRKPIITNYNVFSQENVHFNKNKGISFSVGNEESNFVLAAPNAGSSLQRRTLSDYFERPPGFFEQDLATSSYVPGVNATGNSTEFYGNHGYTKENCIITNGVFRGRDSSNLNPTNIVSTVGTDSRIQYTKIGNIVHAHATIIFSTRTQGFNTGTVTGNDATWAASSSDLFEFKLPGLTDVFPTENVVSFEIRIYDMGVQPLSGQSYVGFTGSWNPTESYIRFLARKALGGISGVPEEFVTIGQLQSPLFEIVGELPGRPQAMQMNFTYFTDTNAYTNRSVYSTGTVGSSTGSGPG